MNMLSLLALWPIVHFVVIYSVSKVNGTIAKLKGLYAVTILDWVFVPFNFLISYSISFNWKIFLLFMLLSLISISILHYKWHKIPIKPAETKFFTKNNGLTQEGRIHFIFMTVQAALVLTLLFSKAIYPAYYYTLVCLMLYIIGYLLIIKFVRRIRLISKVEFPLLIIGLVLLIIRIFIKY
jgi:hypothetical protein